MNYYLLQLSTIIPEVMVIITIHPRHKKEATGVAIKLLSVSTMIRIIEYIEAHRTHKSYQMFSNYDH